MTNYEEKARLPVDAVLLLGPTGVGKSPLGDAIAVKGLFGRRAHHLDFGAELRTIAAQGLSSVAYTPDEIDFIHGVLQRGLLLENEHFALAEKIITLFLKRNAFKQSHLLVLNGLPRHTGQARDLEPIATIRALVVLDCSAEDVLCRIGNNVGGDRTERVDDEIELVRKKLNIFRERTEPLAQYYQKKGVLQYRITVSRTMTPEAAYDAISALATADPPISFVTEPPK